MRATLALNGFFKIDARDLGTSFTFVWCLSWWLYVQLFQEKHFFLTGSAKLANTSILIGLSGCLIYPFKFNDSIIQPIPSIKNGNVSTKLTQYRIRRFHAGKYFSILPVIGLLRNIPENSGLTISDFSRFDVPHCKANLCSSLLQHYVNVKKKTESLIVTTLENFSGKKLFRPNISLI